MARRNARSTVMYGFVIEVLRAPTSLLSIAVLCYCRTLTHRERTLALTLDRGAHVPEVMRSFNETRMLWWALRASRLLVRLLRTDR